MSGSGGLSLCNSQTLHCCTKYRISLLSPGHQTELLAHSRHLVILWCPLQILSKISRCMKDGITILDAFSKTFCTTESSPLLDQ